MSNLKRTSRETNPPITVQPIDAVEDYIQCPRQNARRPLLSPTLDGVGLARVGDPVCEQQSVLAL